MKCRFTVYSFLFFFCLLPAAFPIAIWSQLSKTDSLQKLLLTEKADTIQIKILNSLSVQLAQSGIYSQAKKYAEDILTLVTKAKPSAVISKAAANAYNNIGIMDDLQGNYPQALKNYFAALNIREEMGDKKGIASSYGNIGLIYQEQSNYADALNYLTRELKIAVAIGDKKLMISAYNNLEITYYKEGNYSEALKNNFAGLKISEEAGDKDGMAHAYCNRGDVYFAQGDYPEALKNDFAGLKLYQELEDNEGIAYANNSLGEVSTGMKKFSDAEKYFEKSLSLSRKNGNKSDIKISYIGLAQLDSAKGNYKRALENYKMYIVYRDSLFNEENTKKTVQVQMQYEFDKKESATKAEQDKKDAVAKEERRKQQVILYSVIGGLGVVLLFAIFIYRSLIQIRKKNIEITKQKHIIEEKQKEILDSIRYAKRIQDALLPKEKYIEKTLNRLKKIYDKM